MSSQRNQSDSFRFKRAAFYNGLKNKVGLAAAKAAVCGDEAGTASSRAAISCGTLDDMKLEQTSFINGNKNLLYPQIPFFLSSRAYRDPTVPITQYNGLCHVTRIF